MSNEEIQEVFQLIKKVDSLPNNEVIVVYTKGHFTSSQYHRLVEALEHIKGESELGQVLVVPHDDLEIKKLTSEDRTRLLKLLGVDMVGINSVLGNLGALLEDPSELDVSEIKYMHDVLSKAVGKND